MKDGGWEGVTATVKKCVCTRVWCSPEILLGIRITLLSPLLPPPPPFSLTDKAGKTSWEKLSSHTHMHTNTHKTHTQAKHTNTYANARTKLPVSCSLATLSLSFQNTHCHIQLRLAGSHSSRRYTGTFEKENSPALSLSSLSLSLSLSLSTPSSRTSICYPHGECLLALLEPSRKQLCVLNIVFLPLCSPVQPSDPQKPPLSGGVTETDLGVKRGDARRYEFQQCDITFAVARLNWTPPPPALADLRHAQSSTESSCTHKRELLIPSCWIQLVEMSFCDFVIWFSFSQGGQMEVGRELKLPGFWCAKEELR